MSHESERRFPGLDDLRPEDIWVDFRTGPLPEPSPGWEDWHETITEETRWVSVPARDGSLLVNVSEHGDVTVTGIARADQ